VKQTDEGRTLMRGWVSGLVGIGGLALSDDLRVPSPGPGEIRVRTMACGVNFSDILMLKDMYQVRPERPFVPGQELSGVIEAVGPDVRLSIGTKVACEVRSAGFAEYAVVPERAAICLPPETSFADAAAIPVCYGTAVVALSESTMLAAGETVLVHGASGGVGLACIQVAKAFGAIAIAAVGSTSKMSAALVGGAASAVDCSTKGWPDRVRELTNGNGVDVVVDTVGGERTLDSLRCLARGGRLMIVGFASGTIPHIPANRLLLKRASAIGVYWDIAKDTALWERVKTRIVGLTASGHIQPAVHLLSGFERLPEALALMEKRESVGKIVLGGLAKERG
jgi:NADPH2:quinone reductase